MIGLQLFSMVLCVRSHRFAIIFRVDVMHLGKVWCGFLTSHHCRNIFQLVELIIDSILMHLMVCGVYLRAFQWLISMP
jgi:hypothetical protein